MKFGIQSSDPVRPQDDPRIPHEVSRELTKMIFLCSIYPPYKTYWNIFILYPPQNTGILSGILVSKDYSTNPDEFTLVTEYANPTLYSDTVNVFTIQKRFVGNIPTQNDPRIPQKVICQCY
jgi:hypothetical protein